MYQIWCFYAVCHNFFLNGPGYTKETQKLSIICNLSLHQAPMLGTNPEKASNIMACPKNGELFYGRCNTKLHFTSLNIISPSQYKCSNRLRDNCQQRTLRMSASCYTHLMSLEAIFAWKFYSHFKRNCVYFSITLTHHVSKLRAMWCLFTRVTRV